MKQAVADATQVALAIMASLSTGVAFQTPIGYRKDGTPIWPMGGGDGTYQSFGQVTEAVTLGSTPQMSVMDMIGKAASRLDEIAAEMTAAKAEDTARWQALNEERQQQAAVLTELQKQHQKAQLEEQHTAAMAEIAELKAWASGVRAPSKAAAIGGNGFRRGRHEEGAFIGALTEMTSRDPDKYLAGKAALGALSQYEDAWGKSTLGSTDATGGWIIPNAIVDDIIVPAQIDNVYRKLMTVVPGVTAASVDLPFRSAARARAVIAGFGTLKENVDLAYNGYTATMYTLARIYDIGNQFLRQSRGAAERDVMSELAAAFAIGEAYYVREGNGSSQPYGYTSALTSGPAAFRTANPTTLSDSTVAGSIARNIAAAGGALAGRGVKPTAAVLTAAAYWQMLAQGSDSAGFWFATVGNSPASINPGTLVSPFGIPVYADPQADLEATAAVIDNLVVADWKKFKLYFGQSYRVDTSDQAGTRWDYNLTGFRGEEEMGFDARPPVYAGYAQMILDIIP